MNLADTGHYVADAGAVATGATGQFLFDTAAKTLWWDVDGTGAAAAVLIVDLSSAQGWSAGEISVIA